MGSIEEAQPIQATISFPVDIPIPKYNPYRLGYGKAPNELITRKTTQRKFALKDFRQDVLNDAYSTSKSREYLRDHGFTVIKHNTLLHSPPYGQSEHFLDADLVGEIYYAEIKQLMRDVTGCSQVFITNSVVRHGDAKPVPPEVDKEWQKARARKGIEETPAVQPNVHTTMHKTTPTPPARIPHWDWTPVGARATIRNWSEDMTRCAEKRGIMDREDQLCGSISPIEQESNPVINEDYDGPRYACFSVWRPLTTVTRDPLVMAPYRSVEDDPDMRAVTHRIKAPGPRGDWLQELATLKVNEEAAERSNLEPTKGLQWHYVSNQKIDEVLLIKAFDSAALPGQAKLTGEASAAVHGCADIGEAAHGAPRESVEVRLVAFW